MSIGTAIVIVGGMFFTLGIIGFGWFALQWRDLRREEQEIDTRTFADFRKSARDPRRRFKL
jgi:hypothetical protein